MNAKMTQSDHKCEIILVRHGRPELSRNVRLTARDYEDWWARYDESGLRAGQRVPDRIAGFAARADKVVSSPLRRAVESATLARDGAAPDEIMNGMVEAPLPPPGLGPIKMRPISWGTVSRVLWLGGHAAGRETASAARARAARCAQELEALTGGERRITVFAHGWFNRMVGRQLRKRGWRMVEGRGDAYWSYRRFEK